MTAPESAGPVGVPEAVAAAWALVLGFDGFEPDDDFFALGADSADAATVARHVGLAAGVHVPPRALHQYPTFRGFCAHVAALREPAPVIQPRPDPARHPWGPGQERLWLLSRLHPDRATYTVPTIVRLDGELDRDALRTALTALITRHEPLRTIVEDADDAAGCRVLPPEPVALEVSRAADESEAREKAAAFLARPFRLDREPPFRACLLRLDAARSWLVIAVYHIATDGESVQIMLNELGALYRAALSGAPAETALPALGTAYGDLAEWRARTADPGLADRLSRRAAALRGLVSRPLALEGGGPGGPAAPGRGLRRTRRLGGELTEAVRASAGSNRTTVFITLMTAFCDVMARWSGSRDVCVGYPLSVREPSAARDLIGFFVDTCVIRVDLSGRPSFARTVGTVHGLVQEAAANAVPFDALAEAVAAERGHRDPIFHVWFNHLGGPVQPPVMPGLTASVLDSPAPAALFDVNVYVTEHDDDIRLDLICDAQRCSAEAAGELLDQYLSLITAVTRDAGAPMSDHRLDTARSRLLPDPEADLRTPKPASLARGLARAVHRHPESIAVRDASGERTYRELRGDVAELARALREAGIRHGDTVAVCIGRSRGLIVAMLGAWSAGARLLMLDPGYPRERLAEYLRIAQAGCLVAGADTHDLDTEALLRLDETGRATVARAAAALAAGPAPQRPAAAYIAFTSGTTGIAAGVVGVVGGFAQLEHFLSWYTAEFALDSHDRYALLAGIAHDPLYRDVLLPLTTGASLCVPSREVFMDPAALAAWLREEKVTVAHLTPPLARLLADTGIRLPDLRSVCLAGDAVGAEDVERLAQAAPNATLVNGFGTTETPQLASFRVLVPAAAPALGARAPGAQLLVLRPDGARCGIGEAGAIVVRSRHLARELLGPREFAQDAVAGVRRFRTGDLGRYRTDGSVEYLGREDDTVKIRGYRAHPAETDRALAADPRVSAAATVTRAGPDGPELISYVVAAGASESELLARLRSVLPAHLVPAAVVILRRMPLTANGKVDRGALGALVAPRRREARAQAPADRLESQLARIWSTVLGRDEVDVTDNFFDLGGTSLKLLRVHAAIRREIDEHIPLLALYQNPSIRSLSRCLTGGATPTARAGSVRGSASDERSRRLAARRALAGGSVPAG